MKKPQWTVSGLIAMAVGSVHVFAACGSEVGVDIPGPDASEEASSDPDDGGNDTPSDSGHANGDGSASDGDGSASDGGSSDGASPDPLACSSNGATCTTSLDCCSANCIALDGGSKVCGAPIECKPTGTTCTSASECCGLSCKDSLCQRCVPDSPTAGSCTSNADCCSQNCSNGKCAPVPTSGGGTPSCRTSGNPCASGAECCSQVCNAGVCADVSFCTQNGDICANDFDCCGGSCLKAQGATAGRCATTTGPGGGCNPTGTICTGGGADTACDNKCCSRACGPYGAVSGVKVCQPPSGCLPEYEVCGTSADCCGSKDLPQNQTNQPPVICAPDPRSTTYGRCEKHNQCSPPGAICKVGAEACGVNNRCCEPLGFPSNYCQNNPDRCCGKDALGIPRCLVKPVDCTGTDGGTPPQAGDTCATGADCCGMPCVNGVCEGACVPKGGSCTNAADCCSGVPCTSIPGSTKGVCGGILQPDGGVAPPPDGGTGGDDAGAGTDGGTGTDDAGAGTDGGSGADDAGTGTCALYGQACAAGTDCCNGVPCTAGRCRYP